MAIKHGLCQSGPNPHPKPQAVVQMDHSVRFTVRIHNQQGCDRPAGVSLHLMDGARQKLFPINGFRPWRHNLKDFQVLHGPKSMEEATDIAVRQDPDQASGLVDYARHAQTFLDHLDERLPQKGLSVDSGNGFAGSHHILDAQRDNAAEGAPRMEEGEVFLGESLLPEDKQRQHVAQNLEDRGAGGRYFLNRPGLFDRAYIENQVGEVREL